MTTEPLPYTINSPLREYDPSAIDTTALRSFFVPSWIYDRLVSKFNLVDIHDYSKLRELMSVKDIAHIEILSSVLSSKLANNFSLYSSFQFLSSVGTETLAKRTEEQQREIDTTVRFLIEDRDTVNEFMSKIKDGQEDDLRDLHGLTDAAEIPRSLAPEEKTPPYRIIQVNSTLYIVVERGFLEVFDSQQDTLDFLSAFLKSALAVLPVRVVNSTPWYEAYVKTLVGLKK